MSEPIGDLEDMDAALEGLLTLSAEQWSGVRDSLYSSIFNGEFCKTVDYNKRFIFKPTPSYIVNQNLCIGQPIKPLNTELNSEYEKAYSEFKNSHPRCFRCTTSLPVPKLQDCGGYSSENYVMYLPKWIENQLLFENEPVAPPSTVQEFYTFYILKHMQQTDASVIADNWNIFPEKTDMLNYYFALKEDYLNQHIVWKRELSVEKRKRYNAFCTAKSVKQTYKKRIGENNNLPPKRCKTSSR